MAGMTTATEAVIERNAKSVNAGRLAETNPKKRHDCGLSLIQWQGRSWAPTLRPIFTGPRSAPRVQQSKPRSPE